MEVITDAISITALRQQLRVVQYDSPAFRDQPRFESKKRREMCDQYNGESQLSNLASDTGGQTSARFRLNEIVNACYAQLWRAECSQRNFCNDEPGIEYDDVMKNAFNVCLGKDLDKVLKLRLKSRAKFRNRPSDDDAQKWLETPEKFIETLTTIRHNTKDRENAGLISKESHEVIALKNERSTTGSQHSVRFSEHALLCSALQEGDAVEVENIIKQHGIELNALSEATGYSYLHKTILNNQMECAKVLVRNRMDVDAKDCQGLAPLDLAFRMMNFSMVTLLVDSGANISEYTERRIESMKRIEELSSSVMKVFEMDV